MGEPDKDFFNLEVHKGITVLTPSSEPIDGMQKAESRRLNIDVQQLLESELCLKKEIRQSGALHSYAQTLIGASLSNHQKDWKTEQTELREFLTLLRKKASQYSRATQQTISDHLFENIKRLEGICKSLERETKISSGSRADANWNERFVALEAAKIYRSETGKMPNANTATAEEQRVLDRDADDPGTGFPDFLEKLLCMLHLQGGWKYAAKWAVEKLEEEERKRTNSEKTK